MKLSEFSIGDLVEYTQGRQARVGCIHEDKLYLADELSSPVPLFGSPCDEHQTRWLCSVLPSGDVSASSSLEERLLKLISKHVRSTTIEKGNVFPGDRIKNGGETAKVLSVCGETLSISRDDYTRFGFTTTFSELQDYDWKLDLPTPPPKFTERDVYDVLAGMSKSDKEIFKRAMGE